MIAAGSVPTMITPFLAAEEGLQPAIDWLRVDQLVDWYFANGCVGVFSPCQSSEMYQLTSDERLALACRVHERTAGRGTHVAVGTYGGSIEEQADFARRISAHCDAVVVVTCFMDQEKKGDETWKENAEKFLSLTPDIPLGLYECPLPYKRLLSPELLRWCAASGRFYFHKDTSCDKAQIKAKIVASKSVAGTPFRFFNANVETLSFSLDCGGDGFSGISANFYPHFHSWMVATMKGDRYKSDAAAQAKVATVQQFLTVAENVVVVNYPASPKKYLSQLYRDFQMSSVCRVEEFQFNEQQDLRLHDLGALARVIAESVGIHEVSPTAEALAPPSKRIKT